MKKPSPPIKVTICPPAFAAPCSATLNPVHALAIRAHNDALEARYQENASTRRVPIVYGKKKERRALFPRSRRAHHVVDIVDELPGGA